MFWKAFDGVEIPVAKHQVIGKNVSSIAFEMNGAMGMVYNKDNKKYQISPDGPPLPEDLQAELRRGYYAAVAFTDFEVGRILDELDTLGLADDTAVILHADHGWKLGKVQANPSLSDA